MMTAGQETMIRKEARVKDFITLVDINIFQNYVVINISKI